MATHEMRYGDLVYRPSHPGNLAAIGALFGIQPPSFENCRVLELGCGTGFNLIAMSRSLPGAHLTGIDISESQIQHGRASAEKIGAGNVELHCVSINDFKPPPGTAYDYIVAHGVYSWVPDDTRNALLSLLESHLAADGLAFVSYNTNPGWRLRNLVRDALQFVALPGDPPDVRVSRAKDAVDLLAGSLVNPESTYSRAFVAEWENARDNPDYYLAHEHLLPENRPYYFEEFVREISVCGLQFVAEARLGTNSFMQDRALRAQLDQAAGNAIIRREQHLDWLVGRYFRQSLLCRADKPLPSMPDPNVILQLHVASMTEILDRTEASVRVRQQDGAEYEISDAGYRAVLELLEPFGECPVATASIAGRILSALKEAGMSVPPNMPGLEGPMVAALLWSGCADAVWTIRADLPAVTAIPGLKPAACRLARFQAAQQGECTNRLHRSVALTAAERELLLLLDGTRSEAELAIATGRTEGEVARSLRRLASLALLTP